MSWQWFREWLEIENAERTQNPTWRSRYESMKQLFDVCEWLGCETRWARYITMSNWEAILGLANIAASRQEKETLEDLFQKAGTMKHRELRIALFGNKRPVVEVGEVTVRGRKMITLTAPEAQFRLIKSSTDIAIEYQQQEHKEVQEEHKLHYRVV